MSSFLGADEFEAIANQYSQYIDPSEANLISIIDGDPNSTVMYGVGDFDLNRSALVNAAKNFASIQKINHIRRKFAESVAALYFTNRSSGEYYTGNKFRSQYMQFLDDLHSPKLMKEISKMFGGGPMAPFILWCELFCGKEPVVPRRISKQCPCLNFHIMHIQALRESTGGMYRSLTKRSRSAMSGTGEYMNPEQVADSIDHLRLLPRSTVSMSNRYPLPTK
jgi:hypothetical protein